MNRRKLLQWALGTAGVAPVIAAVPQPDKLDLAADVLAQAVADGRVHAASLYVRHRGSVFGRSFGAAQTADAIFLIASISKPMTVAALMTLFDQGRFGLDDPARKYLPEFTGAARDRITVRQLLTHVSGLPDQLPENTALRKAHAPLSEFVARALRTPLLFEPGSQYSYSSMAILLASEIGRRISGTELPAFLAESLFRPLEMKHSALGLGTLPPEALMRCQAQHAAAESGAGDPSAREWDWNSPYWRRLGAPWGGVHASAPDVARFFTAFLHPEGQALRPETTRLILRNHNPAGVQPRGLGFDIGASAGSPGCSDVTFGHGGSTGTLAWADPRTDTVCVVLTTLPADAVERHPRTLTSDRVAEAVRP